MSVKKLKKNIVRNNIPRVSICMIVKNEENNLPRLLKSITPLISDGFAELIIVDTGSTDKTIEIARKYTDRIYETEWTGFSDARNKSISYAKGDWIFILDADEEVPYESCINLRRMLLDPKINKYNTISIEVRDYKAGSNAYNIFSQTLLFKNDGEFHYKGKIHNVPVFKYPMVKTDAVYIYHYGYQDQAFLLKKIKERTLPALLKEYEEDPKSMHALIHLTQAYSILKQDEKVIFYGEKHRSLLKKFYPNVHEGNYAIYSYLTIAYYNLDKRIRLYEVAKEALDLYPKHLDAAFILCELFLLKEKDRDYAQINLENAIELYRKISAKNLHKYSDFEYVSWDSAPRFFYELARIYDSKGEKERAQDLLKEILSNINPKHEPSFYSILVYELNKNNISDFLYWFDLYWGRIKDKNSALLDVIRTQIINKIKGVKKEYLMPLFFSYVQTLEYEIYKRYDTKTIRDYEVLFKNSPNDLYPEWIASVLITKYYENKMIQKVIEIAKFLIGKDKDMDRVLKTMLLKLKELGEWYESIYLYDNKKRRKKFIEIIAHFE